MSLKTSSPDYPIALQTSPHQSQEMDNLGSDCSHQNYEEDDDGPNDETVGPVETPPFYASMNSDVSINSYFIRSVGVDEQTEKKLRKNLKFFFMNPYEKWKARRRIPWKLILQFLKIIMVTVQLSLFGYMHSSFVTFVEHNTLALKHIFLKNWDPSYETLPYPPATGAYALYKEHELYTHINYAMKEYYQHNTTKQMGIAGYQFVTVNDTYTAYPMTLCITKFIDSKVFPNGSFVFNSEETTNCLPVHPVVLENGTDVYDIETFLKKHKMTIGFDIMLHIHLYFPLRTINLETYSKHASPKCYDINVSINFDNEQHDGQMKVSLTTVVNPKACTGHILYQATHDNRIVSYIVFYVFTLIVSLLSLGLCVRSLYRAYRTQKVVVKFFKQAYDKKLSWSDRSEFISLWYVLIVCNDIMTTIGTIFLIEATDIVTDATPTYFNSIGVLLGTGSLCTWFGVLRYIGFVKKYNVLLVTLKKATPNVLRFLVCAGIMYFGFMFCGWVTLGPYHIKFRTLTSTSECLFSLVNGDDMFATFSSLETKSTWIWVYSRVYLYCFICLFIYIVLSLFIAVIMDTYETIKNYEEHGYPKTDLFLFVNQCCDSPDSNAFRADSTSGCWSLPPCCKRRKTRVLTTPTC